MLVRTAYKVEKVIVTGFLLVILAGAFLLWLSNNFLYNISTSPVDALFMSTSAVCVTGLATINVGSGMGFLSQVILLCLVQIGGLGFMTGMMLLGLAVGKRIGIKSRIFFLGGLGVEGVHGAVKLLITVIKYTAFLESVGAFFLYIGFMLHGESLKTSIYYAIFHSVSAFCNAGFSLYADGLEGFYLSFVVPCVIMLLIVFGGIGFPVFADCREAIKNKQKISHYTRLVIFVTLWLITGGTCLILISDWNGALSGLPVWAKVWNALFQSVTARTAGFDMIAQIKFSSLGQVLTIFLMIIGASPASTGGGIKTTTFGVLAAAVWNEIRGRDETTLWHRKISDATVRRALALAFVYIITFFIGAVILTMLEDKPFGMIIYEAVSAMGTVGLSLGITPELSASGKIVLILLMYWGRVGILSFFAALVSMDKGAEVHYSEVHIPIG